MNTTIAHLYRLGRALACGVALVLVLAVPARAQDESQKLQFQFKDADLDLVLTSLSKSLGLTFIQQVPLAGMKITAVSDRPIPRDRAIAFLNSALQQHQVAAVQVGEVVKIVSIEDAKKLNHAIRFGADPEKTQFGDEIITQIIPLEVLDAESVKKELGELTSKSGQFLLNTKGNVIVLTDTESNVKRFQAIIKQIDTKVTEVLKLKVFRLKHANAGELAEAIDEMFKPFTSTQQRGGQGGGGDPRQRMIQMMMGGGGGPQGGNEEPTRNAIVRTTVEKRTNTLIVQANDNTLKQITDLVTELDQALTALVVVRQYRLEQAIAADVAKVLKAIFEPEQQTTQSANAGGQQQRMMQMMQVMRQGGQGAGGGSGGSSSEAPSESIKVTSDERTNTVVVAASRENQALIEVVVEGLDRKVDLDQEVRVYPLENADAESLKKTLEEIFELQQANRAQQQQGTFQQGRGQQGGGQQGGGGRAPGGGAAGGTGSVTQARNKIRVSADSRTNSLVVTATKEDFESIEMIVKQLDSDKADLESTMVVKLLNADATLLQGLLTNLLQAQATTGGGGGANRQQGQVGGTTTSSNVGGLTGQVRVRADTDSNSLVFVTASRNFETLRRLIAELDQERPQVLIKALIAEVDLDDSTELGVEYKYTDVDHEGSDDPHTHTYTTDFDVVNKPNGFNYNFTRNNFNVLVRALRKDGKLKVVSAPRILVQDNEQASINLGSEVPFVTNTRLTNEGTTLNTIQYRDIGIILTVTPSINPQGLVRMVVSPEISEIAPDSQSVQITEGVRSPVFLKNVATTTITVRDGQTIVLGGLIQDRVRETEDKIPFLGDIPLIGFLFGNRLSEKKKVELMIFITPYVVHQSDALRELTAFEIANYRLVPAREVIQREIPKMPITVLDD